MDGPSEKMLDLMPSGQVSKMIESNLGEGNNTKRRIASDFGIPLILCGHLVGANEKPDRRVLGKLPSERGHPSVFPRLWSQRRSTRNGA